MNVLNGKQVVLGLDTNTNWNSPETDVSGAEQESFIIGNKLIVINKVDEPHTLGGNIDVRLAKVV